MLWFMVIMLIIFQQTLNPPMFTWRVPQKQKQAVKNSTIDSPYKEMIKKTSTKIETQKMLWTYDIKKTCTMQGI